jgi:hypothetical protein
MAEKEEGLYWVRGICGWEIASVIKDYLTNEFWIHFIGQSDGTLLKDFDESEFGPKVIIPEELQNGNGK